MRAAIKSTNLKVVPKDRNATYKAQLKALQKAIGPHLTPAEIREIAEKAELAYSTVYNFAMGNTTYPRDVTIDSILAALGGQNGYRRIIVPMDAQVACEIRIFGKDPFGLSKKR